MRAAAAGTGPPPAGSPFARARAIADTALQHVALVSSVAETTIKAAYKVRVSVVCRSMVWGAALQQHVALVSGLGESTIKAAYQRAIT